MTTYAMSTESAAFARETTSPVTAEALASVPQISTRQRRSGAVLSGIAMLFLAFDASMKVLSLPAAVEGTAQLGYPPSVLVPLGLIQIACLLLYLVPRVAPLGAILWTGYLGGAIATHVRLSNPLFTHELFPIYVAALLWGGLWLRDARVRALLGPGAKR